MPDSLLTSFVNCSEPGPDRALHRMAAFPCDSSIRALAPNSKPHLEAASSGPSARFVLPAAATPP